MIRKSRASSANSRAGGSGFSEQDHAGMKLPLKSSDSEII